MIAAVVVPRDVTVCYQAPADDSQSADGTAVFQPAEASRRSLRPTLANLQIDIDIVLRLCQLLQCGSCFVSAI